MSIIHCSNNLSRLDEANYEPYFIYILDIFPTNLLLISLIIMRDSLVFTGKELLNLNRLGYSSLKVLISLYKIRDLMLSNRLIITIHAEDYNHH